MKQKQISPKIFTEESVETPKHDDMLILYEKNSKLFNNLIEIFKEKISISKEIEIMKDNQDKNLYKLPYIFLSGYNNKIYFYNDINNFLIKHFIGADRDFIKEFENYKNEDKIKLINEPETIKCELKKEIKNLEIINWEPERAITSQNNYYIGSVDLYIKIKINIENNLYFENKLLWKNFDYNQINETNIILEFKPIIKSYSETLRQIKVYKEYIKGYYFVITYSDISKFKNIFESQEIYLIQLKKEEKDE